MKLVVGLGNPGNQYLRTRHNVGFLAIDQIALACGSLTWKTGFKGRYAKTRISNEDVILLKPETFMNLSGESVRALIDFYHIIPADILIIYDDVDLPPGTVRIRESGSSGGHNGMKSIIAHIGTSDFKRIRIGIGKDSLRPTADHVLSNFTADESLLIQQALNVSSSAISTWMSQPFEIVMNRYNSKNEKPT